MDITDYLPASGMTAREFARKIILDVMDTTGITATAGIGTNLFLCKVAMDIVAKHLPADEYGVRIAFLDEMTFRQKLWAHQPLTDFWRIGHGYARKLAENGLFTMGDIARCSVKNEDLLYRLFGKNAELLIDHAWGFEPCTVPEIKAYKPETNSISSGQVLHCPYETDKAKLVLKEMADQLALDLVNKKIVTDQIVLTVGYDIEKPVRSLPEIRLPRFHRNRPLRPLDSKAGAWNPKSGRLYLLFPQDHERRRRSFRSSYRSDAPDPPAVYCRQPHYPGGHCSAKERPLYPARSFHRLCSRRTKTESRRC